MVRCRCSYSHKGKPCIVFVVEKQRMLSQSTLASYLLDQRLISPNHVVEDNLRIVDSSRRNTNFKIVADRDVSYLLKQGVGGERRETVAHEAMVYEFLSTSSCGEALQPFLPAYYQYDPVECALVIELVRNAESMNQY